MSKGVYLRTKAHREAIRKSRVGGFGPRTGRKNSAEHNKAISVANKGSVRGPMPLETRKKISVALSGKNSYLWKGGINKNIRSNVSFELAEWRKSVFSRDKYTCVKCGQIGGKLNADHIRPWAIYPELSLVVSNGQTL